MTNPTFRALCKELVDALLCWQSDGAWIDQAEQSRLIARARTALTQPEPVAPTDEELLAMRSWSSHGPTFDSDLVDFGRRCYNLAKQPVSTPHKLPEPVAPTVMQILALSDEIEAEDLGTIDLVRRALARWGTPANPTREEI